ncbi:MAG TPA: DUF3301 domain-containing protein [Steroidobacteraceae bacterium]|nr:DUF3301 domain-containing protein [Steroidobacteraceae bacterium]
MTEFAAFALLGAALVFAWRAGVEARAVAFAAAHEACERAGLQLLDATVVFKSWRAGRAARGLALYRTYLFDYSEDGTTRRQGFVILRGHEIEIVGLGPTLVEQRLA